MDVAQWAVIGAIGVLGVYVVIKYALPAIGNAASSAVQGAAGAATAAVAAAPAAAVNAVGNGIGGGLDAIGEQLFGSWYDSIPSTWSGLWDSITGADSATGGGTSGADALDISASDYGNSNAGDSWDD